MAFETWLWCLSSLGMSAFKEWRRTGAEASRTVWGRESGKGQLDGSSH